MMDVNHQITLINSHYELVTISTLHTQNVN